VTGRVRDLVDTGSAIEVRYTPRGDAPPGVVTAALAVNCIGPESDYRHVDHPLVKNLLRRGAIRPGPACLGIDVTPGGEVVGATGETSGVLFALGSMKKGLLWESVAVPEIRVQAERLAERLLATAEGA
jgi:uncharacterized NAD(P)/FAD-binding protein YdhS